MEGTHQPEGMLLMDGMFRASGARLSGAARRPSQASPVAEPRRHGVPLARAERVTPARTLRPERTFPPEATSQPEATFRPEGMLPPEGAFQPERLFRREGALPSEGAFPAEASPAAEGAFPPDEASPTAGAFPRHEAPPRRRASGARADVPAGRAEVPVVRADAWRTPARTPARLDEEFVRLAGRAARLLPAVVHDALVEFADASTPAGALLVRGLPVGRLPPTPATPTARSGKDLTSEFWLLTVARRLGQPVGYLPEHGGHLVQNIVPTRGGAEAQVSTSSRTTLLFHTETAFHPHRPRYLLLLALRGDPSAGTTLASIHDLLPLLDEATVETLRQPRFRVAVDASFRGGRASGLGPPRAVIEGTLEEPTLVYDADLMVGVDHRAEAALGAVGDAVQRAHQTVVLEAGDLLVVDNNRAVHGRTRFTPRFDGHDRWLQRTFVVADLAPSAGEREGRVITTAF